jgi:hypothetical protein
MFQTPVMYSVLPIPNPIFAVPRRPQTSVPRLLRPFLQPALDEIQSRTAQLSINPRQYSWAKTHGSSIPNCAFVGGRDLSGEILFVGRAEHEGSITPGELEVSDIAFLWFDISLFCRKSREVSRRLLHRLGWKGTWKVELRNTRRNR